MKKLNMTNSKVLVVGGAGFVGSNLCHHLLENENIDSLMIIDNLISSDVNNIPEDKRVTFVYGSISEYKILNNIPKDINFIFHLACFHGNQSSIADPIADHDNNTITSLMLFNYIKDFK